MDVASDFFCSSDWFEILRRHGLEQPASHMPMIDMAGSDGRLLGHMPLMQMRPGGKVCSLSNYYSGIYGPVMCEGTSLSMVDWWQVGRQLSSLPGSAVIQVQPLDPDGQLLAGLREGLRAHHYLTDCFFCFGNWHFPQAATSDFASYWATRPSKLRHTVERAQRRLARHHHGAVDVIQQPGDALDQGIEAFQRVYTGSWKPAEPRPDFMPALMRMAALKGILRLGLLSLDGEAVAAQVWLVSHGKAYIFKLAHLPGRENLSVGSVLTTHLMQYVMDVDGVSEIDFLSGDDTYKQDWMSHRRERVGLIAFNLRRPIGVAAALRHGAGRLWRQIRASGPSKPSP